MKFAIAVTLLAIFGASFCYAGDSPQSVTQTIIQRFIKLIITITQRFSNGKTTQQVFTITVTDFQQLLASIQKLYSKLTPDQVAKLQPIVDSLSTELQLFAADTSNEQPLYTIGSLILSLINELAVGSNPDLLKILAQLQADLTVVTAATPTTMMTTTMKPTTMMTTTVKATTMKPWTPAAVTTKPPTTMPPTTTKPPTTPTTMAPTTTKMTIPTAVTPSSSININIVVSANGGVTVTYPKIANYAITLLQLILESSTDPNVVKLVTDLKSQLDNFFAKPNYDKLIQVLLSDIQLQRANSDEPEVQSLYTGVLKLVLSLMGQGVDGLKYPISVPLLISLMTELNSRDVIDDDTLDANLALLQNGKQNDPLNILKVLLAFLKAILPSITNSLKPDLQAFTDALAAYVANPSGGNKDLLSKLSDLVDATVNYAGADRKQMVTIVSAILRILQEVFPADKTTLQDLLDELSNSLPTAAPGVPTTAAPSDQGCDPELIPGLLCAVGNLLGGVLGSLGGSSGSQPSNSGENNPGGNSGGGLGGLLGGLLGLL